MYVSDNPHHFVHRFTVQSFCLQFVLSRNRSIFPILFFVWLRLCLAVRHIPTIWCYILNDQLRPRCNHFGRPCPRGGSSRRRNLLKSDATIISTKTQLPLGSLVLLWTPSCRVSSAEKLLSCHSGPYKTLRQFCDMVYEIAPADVFLLRHVDSDVHVARLKPYILRLN